METIRQVVTITSDRKIEVTLPESVQPGRVEIVIVLQPIADESVSVQPPNFKELLGFLPKRVDPLEFERQIRNEWNR
ncbi:MULTISPECIES: hypothetical protein [Cyanophyceae]|nr:MULTISPECIES: hypothetical protein [Cyanophyceae]MBF2083819.1 hypothetical protein [Thermoleptolyngbya sp. C42_A2020_037]BAU44283.1 hypothetical protein O77CONTIG1_04122 [Leptolyngbya sp. O-77]